VIGEDTHPMKNGEAMLHHREEARVLALGVLLVLLSVAGATASLCAQDAAEILEATGVKGGFVVHLGCGDGKLTVALRPNEYYVVQGLDADADQIEKARAHIRSLKLYGPVAVEQWSGKRLPYADNLVSLFVAEDLGDVPMDDVMRVLAPYGVAYVKRDGTWTKTVKPCPKNTDEWTHFFHDASGNPVAHDQVVGPPRSVQWIAEPRHARSHEYSPSINAVVSTGGRIFYIVDKSPVTFVRTPAEWHLVARNAYNGVLLWHRPIAKWWPHICGWTRGPLQLQRKLVAVGDRAYATLGLHAMVSAVDIETGETVKTYDGTAGTEEILYHKGILLLTVRKVTAERKAEMEKWAAMEKQESSPLDTRDTADPLIKQLRKIERKAAASILALDAETGKVLWTREGPEVNGIRPLTLSASGDRVFYQKGKDVFCLDLRTGKEQWKTPSGKMFVTNEHCVVCGSGAQITALSAETGKALWSEKPLLCSIRDIFLIKDSVWVGGFKPWKGKKKGKRGPAWGPYFVTQRDMKTGKVLKHIEPEGPGHHHRCWSNKATDRYIIGGRRGAEFIDLKTGEVLWNSWVRGVCRYGTMPCNGLLYAPSHACGCYIAVKLTGFYALGPGLGAGATDLKPDEPRLQRGPAYGKALRTPHSALRTSGWPTYRHDAARSGRTPVAVPTELKAAWQADVGGKLTSVTVADGKVFVSCVNDQRVAAIDEESGKVAWQFTPGARVDSPPTVYGGRAIFGCRDGYVYSLRASDGALAWRLRAARAERRVTVRGQVESACPVPGSVTIEDGVMYLTAGRSSYLDAGIDLLRVRPETGEILSTTPIYSPDPETGKQPAQYGPCYMPGALEDILTCDGKFVYLRDMALDKKGAPQEESPPHLLTLTGFLDDTWAHRSYWGFGTRSSLRTGCSPRDKDLTFGRLLAIDGSMIYGFGRENVDWSNQLLDKPYRLFAMKRDDRTLLWEKALPVFARAMLLADKVLFLAGPPIDVAGGLKDPDEDEGAMLVAISTADGSELGRCPLDSAPVLDGMAAANGKLYMATRKGTVVCMAKP